MIVFFNLKNIYRINDEFERKDMYQYSNFPWLPTIDRKFITVSDFDGDIYYKPNDSIRTCWNVPTICSFEKISIYKSSMYTTIKKSKNND